MSSGNRPPSKASAESSFPAQASISKARAFVGTYGGLSYLAPLYGVTSLAFYSHRDRFNVQHLELARRVFGRFKRGSYVVLDTSDLSVLGLALGEQRGPLARLLERSQLDAEQVPAGLIK